MKWWWLGLGLAVAAVVIYGLVAGDWLSTAREHLDDVGRTGLGR